MSDLICKDVKTKNNQVNSLATVASALYSSSAKDLETVAFFLVFQESIESLRKIQKSVTDNRVSRQSPPPIRINKGFKLEISGSLEKCPLFS